MNEKMMGNHAIEITCIEERAFWHVNLRTGTKHCDPSCTMQRYRSLQIVKKKLNEF